MSTPWWGGSICWEGREIRGGQHERANNVRRAPRDRWWCETPENRRGARGAIFPPTRVRSRSRETPIYGTYPTLVRNEALARDTACGVLRGVEGEGEAGRRKSACVTALVLCPDFGRILETQNGKREKVKIKSKCPISDKPTNPYSLLAPRLLSLPHTDAREGTVAERAHSVSVLSQKPFTRLGFETACCRFCVVKVPVTELSEAGQVDSFSELAADGRRD